MNKKLLTGLFVTLLTSFFTVEAQAADRYVSPTGTGATCTAATPCSVATAITASVTGDRVLFTPGTYNMGTTFIDLPATKKITLTNPGNVSDVVLQGTADQLIRLSGDRSQMVDNITIEANSNFGAIYAKAGSSPTIKNCVLSNIKSGGRAIWNNRSAALIQNNIFKNSAAGVTVQGGNAIIEDNIFLKNEKGVQNAYTSQPARVIVRRNVFSGNKIGLNLGATETDSLYTVTKNRHIGDEKAVVESPNFPDQPFKSSYSFYNNDYLGMTGTVFTFDAGSNFLTSNVFAHNIDVANEDEADSTKQDRSYHVLVSNDTTEFDSDPNAMVLDLNLNENETGNSSALTIDTLTDASKGSWAVNHWAGFFLVANDSAGKKHFWYITGNTGNTLTVVVGSSTHELTDVTSTGSAYTITDGYFQESIADLGNPSVDFNDADGTRNDPGSRGNGLFIKPQVEMPAPRVESIANNTIYTLDGTVTLAEHSLSYLWEQVSGTSVTFSSATVANPTFTTPSEIGTLTFKLTVTDTTTGIATSSGLLTVVVNEGVMIGSTKYATVADALRAANDGDTLVIGRGTYVESNTVSDKVSIVGAGIGQTIFDSFGVGGNVGFGSISVFSGAFIVKESVTIKDMTIQNYRSSGMAVDTSNTPISFENIHSLNNFTYGFYANGNADITYKNCTAETNGSDGFQRNSVTTGTTSYEGIKAYANQDDAIEHNDTSSLYTVENSVVANNAFGINGGNATLVANNIFVGNPVVVNSDAAAGDGVYIHNTVYGYGSANPINIQSGTYYVQNNIFANHNYGLPWMNCAAPATATVYEDYNLFYELDTDVLDTDCPAFGANDVTGDPLFEEIASGTLTSVSANVLTDSSASWADDELVGQFMLVDEAVFVIQANTSTSLTVLERDSIVDFNGTYTVANFPIAAGTTYLVTNFVPKLTNEEASPAIDSATMDYSSATDINNNARPIGAAPDRGAHENSANRIGFEEVSGEAPEDISSKIVMVALQRSSPSPAVTVDYTITGTATNGDDFTVLGSGTLSFLSRAMSGTQRASIDLSIIDDLIDETTETVVITLSNPVNAVLTDNDVYTYSIIDNDEPVIEIPTDTSGDTTGGTTDGTTDGTTSGGGADGSDSSSGSDTSGGTTGEVITNPTVTVSDVVVNEDAGEVTVTVTLSAPPFGPIVTVDYTTLNSTAESGLDYTETSGTLIFSRGRSEMVIVMSILDDGLDETDETYTLELSNPMNVDIADGSGQVTIIDNDEPAPEPLEPADIIITETGTSTDVVEGDDESLDTYTIVLSRAPTSDVVIAIYPEDDVTTDKAEITFTTSDWDVPQVITVKAVDNSIADGPRVVVISHEVATTDVDYSVIIPSNVNVNVTDDDQAGVILTHSGGYTEVSEAGSLDTFDVVLSSQPTSDVTVVLNLSNGQSSLSTTTVVFTPDDWNLPQVITVEAIDDVVAEGNHFTDVIPTATSSDPMYTDPASNNVVVTIIDNDIPGLIITQTDGSTAVIEGSGFDTYTVQLATQSLSAVTVDLSELAGQLSLSTTSLTFNPEDWNVAQTVVVSGVDDGVTEGDHASQITHSVVTTDPFYSELSEVYLPVIISEPTVVVEEPSDTTGDTTGGADTTGTTDGGTTSGTTDGTTGSDTTGTTDEGSTSDGAGTTDGVATTDGSGTTDGSIDAGGTSDWSDGSDGSEEPAEEPEIPAEETPAEEIPEVVFGTVTEWHAVVSNDGVLVIGIPEAYNNTGVIWISKHHDYELADILTLNLTDILANQSEFIEIRGTAEGDSLGEYLDTGDLDGNGTEEIVAVAAYAGFGEASVLDYAGNIKATVTGSETYPVRSVVIGDIINDDGFDDAMFGSANKAENMSLRYQEALSTSQSVSFGLSFGTIADRNLGETAPELIGATTDGLQSQNVGDLNNDGNSDLVQIDNTGVIRIFYGAQTKGVQLESPDVVITDIPHDTGFGRMVAVNDVTGDGQDDLIIGAPEGGEAHNGVIYVLPGDQITGSTTAIEGNEDVILFTGEQSDIRVGSDLFAMVDLNDNGRNEIYTLKQDGTIVVFEVTLVPASTQPPSDPEAGEGNGTTPGEVTPADGPWSGDRLVGSSCTFMSSEAGTSSQMNIWLVFGLVGTIGLITLRRKVVG